jgi:hypothetical protein
LEEKLVEEREAKGANTVAPCTETEGEMGKIEWDRFRSVVRE